MSRLDLTDHQTYVASCIELADRRLGGYASLDQVAAEQDHINRYPNLDRISSPREIMILDEQDLDLDRARRMLLQGGLLAEHTAAGEATRLGLGSKFLIDPARDLPPQRIVELMSQESGRTFTLDDLEDELTVSPGDLASLSLGVRHLTQSAFDLTQMARGMRMDWRSVLDRQHLMIVVNEQNADPITAEVQHARFFGFTPRQVYFMVQQAYHGLSRGKRGWVYDLDSPRRLHNHGQMALQQTMDRQWFYFSGDNPEYLEADEVEDLLGRLEDKVSFNIENLDYLTGSIDLEALALALTLKDQGVTMVMEVVANDPEYPEKGGMAAFDLVLDHDVMIESFQLEGLPPGDIEFLNKNFNHYPRPVAAWRGLRETGLPMPIAVKDGYLYFQPVQGDLNFQLETRMFRRASLKPISTWKSVVHTPEAIGAMAAQDRQPDFLAFVREVTGLLG